MSRARRAPAATSAPVMRKTSRWSETRLGRASLVRVHPGAGRRFLSWPPRSSSILPARCFSPAIGALSLMLLTGYAGQISLGHAGLLAAGAFTVGILFRESNAPFWITLPAAAVVGALLGIVFGLPSLRLRGLYLAVSDPRAALRGDLSRRRIRNAARPLHRHRDRSALARRLVITDGRVWYFVLLAAAAATVLLCVNLLRTRTGRAWRAIRARETVAEALGINVAGLQALAFVISSAHHRGGGSSVRLLPGLRVGRGVLAVPHDSIRRHGDHRRHGLVAWRAARCGLRHPLSVPHRSRAAALPARRRYAGVLFAINYAAFGFVMILFLVFEPLGLVGIWRRVQTYFLLWPFKQRPVAGAGNERERAAHPRQAGSRLSRAPSPRCRASRSSVRRGQIVALLGTNGAGKTTTLRAISGFIGLDDARVTEGTITFDGDAHREPAAARDHPPRHRAGARARQGVPQPDGRGKSRGAVSRARRCHRRVARSRLPVLSAPGAARCANRRAAVGRRAADAGARQRARLPARAAVGRRAVARPCARSWSRSCSRRLVADPPRARHRPS